MGVPQVFRFALSLFLYKVSRLFLPEKQNRFMQRLDKEKGELGGE
jgi:hypothetical protein